MAVQPALKPNAQHQRQQQQGTSPGDDANSDIDAVDESPLPAVAREGQAETQPYVLSLSLVVSAAAIAKCIILLGLSVDSLAALNLTGEVGVATLPATVSQVGSMLSSLPAAALISRYGQRVGHLIGGAFLVAGGLLGGLAMSQGRFWLQLVSVGVTGVGFGFSEYLRFAAAELVPPALKPRAVSLTIASSVVSGVIGPQIAKVTRGWLDVEFQASYLVNGAVGVLYMLVLALVPNLPSVPNAHGRKEPPTSVGAVAQHHQHEHVAVCQLYRSHFALVVATLSCATGYSIMILTMTATPIAMKEEGYRFEEIATTIQTHAVCMFAPGFVTGEVIRKIAEPAVMLVGAVLLLAHWGWRSAGTGAGTSRSRSCSRAWAGTSCTRRARRCSSPACRRGPPAWTAGRRRRACGSRARTSWRCGRCPSRLRPPPGRCCGRATGRSCKRLRCAPSW